MLVVLNKIPRTTCWVQWFVQEILTDEIYFLIAELIQ